MTPHINSCSKVETSKSKEYLFYLLYPIIFHVYKVKRSVWEIVVDSLSRVCL